MTTNKKSFAVSRNGIWRSIVWWSAVLSAVLLTLCGLATFVTPARFPLLGMFVLGFPFFLLATVSLLVAGIVMRVHRWWVPLVILLCNAWAIRIYWPINLPQEEPEGCLKVLSYNVQNFFHTRHDPVFGQPISEYIVNSGADIVCLQEAPYHDKKYFEQILPILKKAYAYNDSLQMKRSSYLNIFSRLPIIGQELVAEGDQNHCSAFTLLDGKDTLYVVNCHLNSMHLSLEEKAGFSGLVHGADTLTEEDRHQGSVMLLTKISAASVERAEQVDKLCAYLERMKGKRVILCGDFNDTAISYAHNRVSDYLKDCYAATATGFGRSFNANSMLVRIDHMFCSEHYKPYGCRVDQSVLLSDHYPIICSFERR